LPRAIGQNIPELHVHLSGQSTIERVKESLAQHGRGFAIGPTREKDRFAYKCNINLGRSFLSKRDYKVEIGDFPGEDTAAFVAKHGPWLHTTEFFKWTMDSDTVVFVIDCSRVWGSPIINMLAPTVSWKPGRDYSVENVVFISSAIRAAWQQLAKYSKVSRESPRRRSIALAFTKLEKFFTWDAIMDELPVPAPSIPLRVEVRGMVAEDELQISPMDVS